MPVGTVSGEPVLKLLISSVAANTQVHETAAVFLKALFRLFNFLKAL